MGTGPLEPVYIYRAKMLECHDGDTQKYDIDQGFHGHQHEWIRMRTFKCPELDEPGGVEARNAAAQILESTNRIILETQKTRFGDDVMTFSRYVAHIWCDGTLLGELLMGAGHAKLRPLGDPLR